MHKKELVFVENRFFFYAKDRKKIKYIRCIYKEDGILYNSIIKT